MEDRCHSRHRWAEVNIYLNYHLLRDSFLEDSAAIVVLQASPTIRISSDVDLDYDLDL